MVFAFIGSVKGVEYSKHNVCEENICENNCEEANYEEANPFDFNNVPKSILSKLDKNLYQKKNHPLTIIKNKIYEYFSNTQYKFNFFEDELCKIVTVEDNFDKLLIPKDHPARSKSDTYYFDKYHVLRTHTTAHQNQLLSDGNDYFIACGDVYRKDEINATHYPIFHQIEGVVLFDSDEEVDLKNKLIELLAGLVNYLFPNCEYRVNPDYFPFTDPSFEVEVMYQNKWLEILGCGIIQHEILLNTNRSNKKGFAFGLGLERLAMILFDIPDIRYFWMEDEKFISQFSSGEITKFIPFSPLKSIYKDVSLFVQSEDMVKQENEHKWIRENDFLDVVREHCDDWIESMTCVDSVYLEKKEKWTRCYRINYAPKNYSLTNPSEFNDVVNNIQTNIVNELRKLDYVEIRG